jgi:DNA-binding beta-propeller fold protein YncE
MLRISPTLAAAVFLAALSAGGGARAEIAVSANDGRTAPDTLTVIDLGKNPPRIASTIEVPAGAVAVGPDESWAIVASDGRVSVIDLKASPPRIAQSLTAGPGASAVRLSPDGGLALVANRGSGTISVFTVREKRLTPAGTVDLGNPHAAPSGLAFTRDGSRALVSRAGDDRVSVLDIDGATVTVVPRPITTGIRPAALDVNPAGTLAAVANLGRDDGDIDSVSLIDLTKQPFRVVEIVGVPSGPTGLKFSPDGRLLAVACQDGSDKPAASPFRRDHGMLLLFAVQGDTGHGIEANSRRLRRVAEAATSGEPRGIVFSRNGRTILVQTMTDREVQVFRWLDGRLNEAPALAMAGGPASIGTAWP